MHSSPMLKSHFTNGWPQTGADTKRHGNRMPDRCIARCGCAGGDSFSATRVFTVLHLLEPAPHPLRGKPKFSANSSNDRPARLLAHKTWRIKIFEEVSV